jgi:DNA polymerase III delta prime subunit
MINNELSENLRRARNSTLHHAYCILGNTVDVVGELEKIFKKELNFSIMDNPDFWYGEFDVMDIEDGRKIKDLHQNRPIANDKKIFVVSANFITEKAQNAMLKLFEEPRGDTHFFLVLPSLNNIISTLRSRFFIIDTNCNCDSLIDVKKFLKKSIGERFEDVKELCGNISSDDESKIEIINFINSIEIELKKKVNFLKTNEEEVKLFEEIEKMRQYASEQSPSLKMILEHLSLMLPVL